MSHNMNLLDWRLTTPDHEALTPDVRDYLDLVREFVVECDVTYFHFATLRGCDVFDVVTMLDWFADEKMVSDGDRKLWEQARSEVIHSRGTYMSDAEVALRMQHGEGHCPFCGSAVSFESQPRERGQFHAISRCCHFRFDSTDDVERTLKSPKAWEGARWPFSWDRRIADTDGTPLTVNISRHCMHCTTVDAQRVIRARVLRVLTEMLQKSHTPGWCEPGWGVACSEMSCHMCDASFEKTGHLCIHQTGKLERAADSIVRDESHEFRLNGAGLKLYTRGVKVGFMRGDVSFNMRVGGDQAAHYGQFVEWANGQLVLAGLQEVPVAVAAPNHEDRIARFLEQ